MAKGKGKKKAKGTSNVFSMFEQSQIQEFKEAFGMIDANRDGFIDKEDLRSTYASLGVMSIENSKLDEMMAEAPAAINFTVFLNMLADKLHGTDSEDVILNAFKLFDPEGKGTIPKDYLGDVLTSQADRSPTVKMMRKPPRNKCLLSTAGFVSRITRGHIEFQSGRNTFPFYSIINFVRVT